MLDKNEKLFIGKSMLPMIDTGFKIRFEPVKPKDISIGDVLIIDKEILICHRIVGRYKIGYKLYFWAKGDGKNCSLHTIKPENIIGRVTEVVNLNNRIQSSKDIRLSRIKIVKYKLLSMIYGFVYTTKLRFFGRRQLRFISKFGGLFAKVLIY